MQHTNYYFESRRKHMAQSGYDHMVKQIKSNKPTSGNNMSDVRVDAARLHKVYNEMDAEFTEAWNAQVVVSLSGGASSAVAGDIALKRYGRDRVRFVFCDTMIEDDDLYRFMDDLEQHWQTSITRLVDGRTPYEIADDEGIIPNQKVATCTRRLKIFLFRDYIATIARHEPVAVVLGLSLGEAHRMHSPQINYNSDGYFVLNPMALSDSLVIDPQRYVKDVMRLRLPRAYELGFGHNNCLGQDDDKPAGCVKFGQGDWVRMLINFPNRFEATARWEHERIQRQSADGKPPRSLLRRTVDGVRVPYSLYDLKRDYELARSKQPSLFDLQDTLDGGACRVECGITLENETDKEQRNE